MEKHWSENYIGKPYVKELHDCAAFVANVYEEQFGIKRNLPEDHGSTPAEWSAAISKHLSEFLEPTEKPKDGDVILCRVRGVDFHLGLLCEIMGERWMLHASNARNLNAVVLTRLDQFRYLGFTVDGFFKVRV